ncbi:hypothetical protein DHEL01_v212872, partial [Diaporthe helianthi]
LEAAWCQAEITSTSSLPSQLNEVNSCLDNNTPIQDRVLQQDHASALAQEPGSDEACEEVE